MFAACARHIRSAIPNSVPAISTGEVSPTRVSAVPCNTPEHGAASGGEMRFEIAVGLLLVWITGVVRVFVVGDRRRGQR